ncbi:hypothetical protein BSKO_10917 [Bryopsis sp. KO-2023]|nr:hypothetical protein BSKO_10917 [Bryopsis sp. KO-2023]
MQEQKTAQLVYAEPPTSKEGLQAFIGLGSYYRRFIYQFAKLVRPLQYLLKTVEGKNTLVWDLQALAAFEAVKKAVTTAPILQPPRADLPYIVDSDASCDSVGAVLSQVVDNKERPVFFFSRVMTTAEKNYSVTEKEGLALIAGLQKFRVYLLGNVVVARCAARVW